MFRTDEPTLAKIQVADPTGANDAVSKGYLDGVQQGFDIKVIVPAVATGNGTLASTLQTVKHLTVLH